MNEQNVLRRGTIPAHNDPTADVAKLRALVESSLDDDKAEDITTIDLAGKTSLADYMVIASGRSQRHIVTLADHVTEHLKEIGRQPLSVEGKETGDWVLVDAGDVIVHIFRPEVRELYGLEKMWMVPLTDTETLTGAAI